MKEYSLLSFFIDFLCLYYIITSQTKNKYMDLLTKTLRQKKTASLAECIKDYLEAMDVEIEQIALLVLYDKMDRQYETTKLLKMEIESIKKTKQNDVRYIAKIKMLEHLLAYNKR